MGRLIRLVLILCIGTIVSWSTASQTADPAKWRGKGDLPAVVENYGHLTVLRLQGTPYEMGYQHGVARRAAIRQLLLDEVYGREILEGGQPQGTLLAHARQLERTFPLDIRHELRGIAGGAGLSYEDLLLLNLVLNRLPSGSFAPTYPFLSPPTLNFQALVFAAWSPAIRQGEAVDSTLLGYRLDVPDEAARLRRHLLAVIYRSADGQAYITLTWSGQVGAWCGLNEAGLAVCATPVESVGTGSQELSPAILTRQLLARAQDGEQALRQAIQHDYVSRFRLVVADGQRQVATTIAFGAHRYDIAESQTGVMAFGPGRAQLIRLLDGNLGWLHGDKALAALSSRQTPEGDRLGPCGESTLLNAMFAPSSGELWVGLDLWPASCRRYLRLRLAS
jgi:hypothetical protein